MLDQVCFPPGIAYSKAELKYLFARRSTFAIAAEKAGHMAGFLISEWNHRAKKAAHIVTIDVAPSERRGGVATQLMDEAEAHYHRAGCAMMTLEVAVDNTGAQAFYIGRGFRATGRIEGYYNGVLDALTMTKLLGTEVT